MGLDLKDKRVAVLISLNAEHRMFKESDGQKSHDGHKLNKLSNGAGCVNR